MRHLFGAVALATALGAGAGEALAHSFKVGLIAPFSGPAAATGEQLRAGFMVATREADGHPDEDSDGHLGGLDVYVLPVDGAAGTGAMLARVRELVEREEVEILTGLADPRTMAAIRRAAAGTEAIVIELSADAAPARETGDPATFAATFERDYGYKPSRDAFAGYGAARLIDRAVRALGGNLSKRQALRAAIAAAGAR
ncbi:MAG: ABC transporter substrate-binding protein [Rhodospirillales bacterium]|nr:ABC transporter substrate-binding protein [Rhodospirillales bacterium]MDH3913348.1 ABC transporter substrate-binding protein [Rhodospirillales bacterium]MDH3917365.1 ABC transporter substrate-binding protein [Rhodospirillales bacterium]MDH3967742.1 ABC transporter substrate-binding protein [Rhodospirillales bacterium]